MKRGALILIGAVVISAGVMLALRAQEQAGAKASGAAVAAVSAAATQAAGAQTGAVTADEKVAFSFADDAQLQQFAQLWRQRQAALTRMATLQAYWRQEQSILDNINKEFMAKYNIDVNKNYRFDADRKVLVELATPPEKPSLDGAAPEPGQASPTEAKP